MSQDNPRKTAPSALAEFAPKLAEITVELITHLAFYTGWPNAMSAATRAQELLGRKS